MKNIKRFHLIALVIATLVLTACGGNSDGSDGLDSSSNPTPTSGGVANAPASLNLVLDNKINSNSHYNYFIYSATKNEKLIINSNLANPLTDEDKTNCLLSPGTGNEPSSHSTQIHVYDRNLNRLAGNCGDSLIFTAPYTGLFILNLEYPTHGPGLFNATITQGDLPTNEPVPPPQGTFNDPGNIHFGGPNEIKGDPNYNYYHYSATKNEKLIIHASLETPLSNDEKTACQLNPGKGTSPSGFYRDIHVYDENLNRVTGNCGDSLSFTAPDTGNFIIHFDFPSHGPGLFNAATIKADSSLPQPTEALGTPSDPKIISLAASGINSIGNVSFKNHYKYSAKQGNKLILHVNLATPLTIEDRDNCLIDPGKGNSPSIFNTQINIYDAKFDERITGICGDSLIFTAPYNGDFILHFDYPYHNPRSFNASEIK